MRLTDSVLRDRVKEELFWSPHVNSRQVRVGVDDGVVTLRGRVDSIYAKYMAMAEAFEAGAADVKSRLKFE